MYEQYFGLREKPFELLPNPGFMFPSRVHRKALAYLEYGLRERSGFILLTGEVGAGKTTLIRNLLRHDLRRTVVSKVFNTRVDSTQLIAMINDDFGLEIAGRDKVVMLRDLNEFLIDQFAAGNRAVLIIDEAQNLSAELLEEVRMLSNLEADNAKLLQIILVGQPELKTLLSLPSLRQLRQRIQVQAHLGALQELEVPEYILYRLERAGNREAVTWEPEAFQEIYATTHGIPRLVNILCDYLMLDAFSDERATISAESVRVLVEEMEFRQQFFPEEPALRADQTGWAGLESIQDPSVSGEPADSGMARAVGVGDPASGEKTSSAAQRMMCLLRDIQRRLDILEKDTPRMVDAELADLHERLRRIEEMNEAMGRQVGRLGLVLPQLEANMLTLQSRNVPSRGESEASSPAVPRTLLGKDVAAPAPASEARHGGKGAWSGWFRRKSGA